VIPGSHKLDLSTEELVEMARQDPSIVYSVVAPAGSTLLFGETLVHATGQIQSDTERTILTAAFGPPMWPYWDDGVLQDDRRLQDSWTLSPAFRQVKFSSPT
jgi:ectoine hydroxylase-related dioxygenase (phytanoyl-CoA dioxygenase family)